MIAVGSIVGGRYEVKSFIGKGGMQNVFLASDNLLKTDVALKTPQENQQLSRFKKSAKISAKINHHNVAKTLDYLENEEASYLIEEFVPGDTLEKKLNIFEYLDPHLGARVLHHIAKGIAASHHAGVIHRDLKPSNIMVSAGPNLHQLKITDFGIATLTKDVFDQAYNQGDLTQSTSGTVRGAIPYMAPEFMFRKNNTEITPAIDIWSIGAMMFRLLTGEYPFGLFLEAAVNVKNNERRPWPSFMIANPQFRPLAESLKKIIDECLNPNPDNRPTADDLVNVCDQLCYLSVDREIGDVSNLIQNGYSGFAISSGTTSFFSMESVYGSKKPSPGDRVCYSSFPGQPQNRAHPIKVIK